MTPSGIKPATLRLGAQCLNQLRAPIHYVKVLMNYFVHSSIFRCYLRNKVRHIYVEKISFCDSASTTKPFADFHEIRCRKSSQKLAGNYEFVKTVSVEVIF
jgi:hypothetical protein